MREKLEQIQLNHSINVDLLNLLENHFEDRCNHNTKLDYWSITRLWTEYTTLLYQIIRNANDIEKNLNEVIKELTKEDKEDETSNS